MVVIDPWIRKMAAEYDDHTDVPRENEYKEVGLQEFHSIFIATGAITLVPNQGNTRKKAYMLDSQKLPAPLPNKRAETFLLWFEHILEASRRFYTAEALHVQEHPQAKEGEAKRKREDADARRKAEEEEWERQESKERVNQMSSALSQVQQELTLLRARVAIPAGPPRDAQKRENDERDRRIEELQRQLRERQVAEEPTSEKYKRDAQEKDRTIQELQRQLRDKQTAEVGAAAAQERKLGGKGSAAQGGLLGAKQVVVRDTAHDVVVSSTGQVFHLVPAVKDDPKKKEPAPEKPGFFTEWGGKISFCLGKMSSAFGGDAAPPAKKHKGDGDP
jgi:hypothetical protein